MKTLSTLAAAACGLAFASAAHAQDVKLSFADLDLSQPADAATFSQRLDTAAKSYCTGQPMSDSGSHARCMANARANFTAMLPTAKRTAYEQTIKTAPTREADARSAPPTGS